MLDESLPDDARILLLGRPGAGKSLVGRLLAARLDAEFFSMGDLLRAERERDSEQGHAIARSIDAGEGVPPAVSYGLMTAALGARARGGALIMDGIPRRAEETGRVCALLGGEPTRAIVLDVPTEVAIYRLTERTICIGCGWSYGPAWPAPNGLCTSCGAAAVARPDDSPVGIERRYDTWGREARDIVGYYDQLGIARTIRADLLPLQVLQRVVDAIVGQTG